MMRVVTHALLATAISGCAAEGGDDGGAAHLPDRGISGWERSATDPSLPFALRTEGATLGGSSAIVVDGDVILYGHRANNDATFELFRARGDAIGDAFQSLDIIGLAGRDPSVARAADGTYWLAYEGADGVAIATSSDGLTFAVKATSGLAADRTRPSIVIEGQRVRLYLSTGTTLVHTEAGSDLAFGAETEVLAPGVDCVDSSGDPEDCWDATAITEAEVRRAKDGTGTAIYRMFYAAHDGGNSDLGFAASYDGLSFTRFAYNPVLTGTANERSPTSVLANDTYVLFWEEGRNPPSFGGIVRATHEPSAPADRW